MTRNIQWRRTGACSDELQLLRNSTTTNHRRRGNTSNRSQNRCVSWAPDTYTSNESAAANGPLSSAVAYAADFREYRKRVARSWCGQTLSSPVGGTGSSLGVNSGSVAGPYGSLEATVADTGALLPSSTTSSPLHSSATQPLLQAADGNIGADTSVTTPQIAATHAAAARLTAGASPLPTKRRVGRSKIDLIMPSLRSLVSRRAASGSTSSLSGVGNSVSGTVGWVDGAKTPIIVVDSGSGNNIDGGGSGGGGSGSSPHAPPSPLPLEFISGGGGLGLRKCETAVTLSTASSRTTLLAEPLQAINRLRVTPGDGARSLCSRCSSLLSLQASGSRYSLNTATAAFVPVANNNTTTSTSTTITTVPCKLCLADVRTADTCALRQCACVFCRDCMQAYVSFEITEGAYDISCPDAQCPAQGVLTLPEIERLVDTELIKKHKKYRLNREVDIDKSRTWCPRAGCETVCELCPSEKCAPQSVHCPTCASDFCSNCKRPWHGSMTCEEQAKLSGADSPPGIPFDSDLIKCCPMCNVPIEKDEGCAQMMCKRCKHVFCWYCLTSLDDDFLLRHYDKGPCKNKLGHSRASVIWHRTQVIGIFAGFGILLLVASPLLLLAAPCIVCCKCRMCNSTTKLDNEEEIPEESASGTSQTNNYIRW